MVSRLFALLAIATVAVSLHPARAATVEIPSSAKANSIWPSRSITVCWENGLSAFPTEAQWVRDAVAQSWQQHGNLTFNGWTACATTPLVGQTIRIQIADVNPHVKALGRHLDDMLHGMVLNFTFDRWSQSCKFTREICIKTIAVHEFGHAVGFTHEQNRPDNPEWCRADAQGTNPDWLVTPYDLHSVMNYCNPEWAGNGVLSDLDIAGVKALYPRLSEGSIDPNAWYQIVGRVFDMCLHVQNANGNRYNELWQWKCERKPQFKFQVEPTSDGYYRIRSSYAKCFHVAHGPNTNRREPLWQWECTDQPHFKFKLERTEDNWFRIRTQSGMCLHIAHGASNRPREPVWTWDCVNQPQFYFQFQPADF